MTTRACRLLRAPKPVFRAVHGRSARRPVRVTNTGSSSQGGGGVPVEFRLPQKVPYGRTAFLVGSCEQLGAWNLDGAKELKWANGDVWQGTVELPVGEEVEYKYVMVDVTGDEKGGQEWQKGLNLRLRADDGGMRMLVTDSWVTEGEHEVETKPLSELDTDVPSESISVDKEGQQGGAASTAQPTVSLDFSIEREVEFGNKMFVVGSAPALGAWSLSKACKMKWADGHVWKASVQVPAGETVEYKYAVLESSGYVEGASVQWQEGPNRVLEVASDAERVEVHDGWKAGVEADVRVEHKKAVEAVAPPPPPAPPAEEAKPILKMEEMEIVTSSGQILSGMSVRELKDQLRELGLSPTGRKMALVGRLSEYLANGGS